MIRFKLFLVILLAIILMGLFYYQTTLTDNQQHQEILSSLRQIDKGRVVLNEQVLRVHQGLLRNYDNLINTVDRLKLTSATLDSKKLGLDSVQAQAIKQLDKQLLELGTSTESFLSTNAILNNSLSYLPVLIKQLLLLPHQQKNTIELAQQLLEDTLLYIRWQEPARKANIENLIKQLSRVRAENSDLLSAIISHSQLIYKYTNLVNQELRVILNNNINILVTSLRQHYMQFYAQQQQQRQYLSRGIYFIAFSLLIILIDLIFALRRSANLLRDSNQSLLAEVQHRKEAEQKQKNEAVFLQTLLDNISDGIVVCDTSGTLMVFNKAAEAIYEQGLKPIPAEQWAQQYQLYDPQGNALLSKEQLPLYKALTCGQVTNQEIVIKFNPNKSKTVLVNGTQIIRQNNEKLGAVICIRDITERKKVDIEMRLAATAFEAHEAIMIADKNAQIIRINREFTEITGYTESDVIGKNPSILKSGKHDSLFYKGLWQTLNKKGYWQGEIWNKRKNAEIYLEWLSISSVKDENGEVTHYVSHFRDISLYKQQQEQVKRNTEEEKVLAKILQFSFLPIDDFLQQASEVIVSLPWLKLKPSSGIFLADNQSKTLKLVSNHNLSPELVSLCAEVPYGTCHCGKAAELAEIQFSSCVDHRHEISYQGMMPHGHYNVPILEGKKLLGVVVLYLEHGHRQQINEINFLKRVANVLSLGISRTLAEQKVEHLAYHDTLTGLPNRMLLMDRLKQVLASNKRQTCFSALMYIDLDRFKVINDTLGHSTGDALLKEVALRFKRVLRQEDTVARLGGDEFVILLSSLGTNKETCINESQHIANKLHSTIAEEMLVLEHSLFITLSIGIVMLTGAEENTETIMMQADTAMYQAKANGRNGTQFFMPEMQAIANVRLELEKDLRHAIERQEIQVFYQPQTNERGGIVGAEALVRWIHPLRGMVSPVDFIPIAEESGFILDIGRYVLEDACQRINQWKSITSLEHIAVNVSPVQFKQPDFVFIIQQVIEKTHIDSKKLTLELTEGILVDHVEDVIDKMQQLKQLGVHFSIDDFGTGYSSLAYLTKFPLDQLKIDKSFVDDIGKDKDDQIIIETIIAMADRLGLNLIAEGVENSEQILFLKDKGCFNFQGYYFSKPLSSSDFSKKYLD